MAGQLHGFCFAAWSSLRCHGVMRTWMDRIETTGGNLERMGEAASEPEATRKAVA